MTQRQKILLAFIFPAIAALVVVWLFVKNSHQQQAVERWSTEHRALVRSIGLRMQGKLDDAARALTFTSRLPEFAALLAVDRIDLGLNGIPPDIEPDKRKTLDALLAAQDNLAVVFVLLPNGDHYLSHPYAVQQSLQKYNLADRPYFSAATQSKAPAISDSIVGADGMPAVIIDIPLLDGQDNIFAHLGGVVYLTDLSRQLGVQHIAPFDTGVLVDRQGMLIGHSDITQIEHAKALRKAELPSFDQPPSGLGEIQFGQWRDTQGVGWLSYAYRLPSGMQLVLSRRLDSLNAEIAPAVRRTSLLAGVLLLLTSAAGLLLAMRFVGRWEAADQQLREAHEHLEQRVAARTAELFASQTQLQKAHDFYLTVLESFPALIWRAGLDTQCNYLNSTWLHFTGRSLAQEVGDGWVEGVHPDDVAHCVAHYLENFHARRAFSMEYRLRRHDGEYRWILDMGNPLNDLDGQFIGYLGVCYDVTERHQAAEQLNLIASVFLHAHEGIMIAEPQGRIVDVNQAFTQITGFTREEAIGQHPSMLHSGDDNKAFYQAMWQDLAKTGQWQGEIWNHKKSGEAYVALLTLSAVTNTSGEVRHYLGIFSDITLQKEHEQRLEKLAHFDPLTGLPNRALLNDRLDMSIALATRNKTLLAVCVLDLDGFKAVNDNYGHAAGDQLLIEFARRTQLVLRDTDTLSRLGGDEFVILLNNLETLERGMEIVRRVLSAASQRYDIEGDKLSISASVGVTIFPDDGDDPDLLMRHADQAMYIAKQGGRNRYFLFDPMKDQAARHELAALQRLETALSQSELILYYQPKVDMQRGIVTGVEALIRWHHPERGLLPPSEFLAVSENHDLAIKLGEWVLSAAVHQADAWHHQGLALSISVNIAARHLSLADFTPRLALILSHYPTLPHGRIELEILETAALSDTRHVSQVIESCRELGISFALDDFGTGYSSLLYLKQLPAETLKIDQSFVRDMQVDAEDLAIVKGVIGLATAFNRRVIAEGVETIALGDALIDLGCTHAQGYGIARPMPASAVAPWLANWKAPNSWQASRLNRD